jgi:hypothetical protein
MNNKLILNNRAAHPEALVSFKCNFFIMNSKWLRCRFRKPAASVYLLCFPWAGGGANYYAGTWGQSLPDFIEGKRTMFCQFAREMDTKLYQFRIYLNVL